jgi:structural maintenance of chromosome 2
MKPQEILGMVEEAAGTRMFEERKDKAKKTMGKKEKKVAEITHDLENEIVPKLDRLRGEKRAYLSYEKACSELERLSRVLRAWEWREAHERVRKRDVELEKKKADAERVQKDCQSHSQEVKDAEAGKVDAEKRRDAELRKGGAFAKREAEVKELEVALVKLRTQAEIMHTSIQDEEKRSKQVEEGLGTVRISLDKYLMTC